MKHEVPIRIVVRAPLAGVAMMVQRGRSELLAAASTSADELLFDLSLNVDLSAGAPNFLGVYAQGPKDARFIYVNSGSYAGQPNTCWDRRAKVSLMGITRDQVEKVLGDASLLLSTEFNGVGRDGGPTCASVKGIEWRVAAK